MDLPPHPADHPDRLAKVDLRMARRMRQRNERLAPPSPLDPDVILHHRIAAGEAVLVAKPLKNPLRRMPLLHRSRPVDVQDRIDHRKQWAQLRLLRQLRALVARRQ